MMGQPSPLRLLHRRLAAAMGLAAVTAFVSGAGLDTLTPLVAVAALLLAMVWAPGPRLQHVLDPIWRILALGLTARALYHIFVSPADVVLPMVDLLLALLVSENLKESGAADTRVYSLSFALLIAACAYRPGVVFAVSFVVYTVLATITLMVGHFIRKLTQHQARDVRLERAFLLRIAAMSSVMLAMSALVFAAFPRVSRGWVMRGAAAANVVGFSDRVSLAEHGSRIYPNPEVVLRVEFADGPPANTRGLYWRGRSYDFFDGVAWGRSPAMPMSSPSAAAYAARWPGERTEQRIYAVPLDIPVLFGLHPVLRVQSQSRMRAMQDNVGDLWYFGSGSPTYDVVSAAQSPSAEALRAAAGPPARGEEFYLQLPVLSRRVLALADSLTSGAATRYDAVVAVQNWLRTEFTHTLELPATAREATLEHFLLRRRAGHCEYFSTALALMLRAKGIPARNVNGFLGGTWNEFGAFLTVTQNEAHSWVEVFFPGYGWVEFDGTPAATAGAAQAQRNWLNPFTNVFAGLEHRWNKWILEYNLEQQVSLFRRATEPFAQRDERGGVRFNPALTRALKYGLIGGGLVVVLAILFRRVRFAHVPLESRVYLKLRRSYEKAGFRAQPHAAPMMFVDTLARTKAPGHEAARQAVELYLRARFGGEDIGDAGQRELRELVARARRALRAA
jgi:transglutaminase-like putative cysteine protease